MLLAYSLIDSCGDSWQVWNFDEKGVSPEGKWCAVFTETVEIIDGKQVAKRTFRHTTAEKAPFWVTIGLFTRADGQCPCGPIICHQAAKLSWLHAAAALDYVNALDTAELKCILTHMKVTLTTNSKKDLLKLLRQHLDPAHESKLWSAEEASRQAEASAVEATAESLFEKLGSLTPQEALKYFNQQEVSVLKRVLVHMGVSLPAGPALPKKQVLTMVEDNLPREHHEKLSRAHQAKAAAEEARLQARYNRELQQGQHELERKAAYDDFVEHLGRLEPAAATDHFGKLDLPTVKKVLAHMSVPMEGQTRKAELLALLRAHLPEDAQRRMRGPGA